MADSPGYYTRGGIEVWDFIQDQRLSYHLGNAVKYICRAGHKDSYIQDLRKQFTTYKMSFNMQHAEEFRHTSSESLPTANNSTQKTLIVEEVKEFLEAEQTMINGFTRNESECLKELADVVYVCFQFASVMDWDLDEALRRVHQSNLSKLDDEGKPVLRADGKVMKGPNYQPPDLSDLVCLN